MSKRFLFLGLTAYVLILAAALAHNGQLVLLAVPIFTYLIVGFLRAPAKPQVRAERYLSKNSAETAAPVEMKVYLENQGSGVLSLKFGDVLQPGMKLESGRLFQRTLLPQGETAELSYAFSGERGCYAWQSLEVTASDPFGLIEVSQTIDAPGEVLVMPVTQRLKHIPLRPRHTLHSAGPIPARRGGTGTDFWGLRMYRPGDPLRSLNWRKTARYPHQFFSKEFEQEEIADIGLILDARSVSDHSNGDHSLFEHATSACASLAELFMREGNRVGLMIYGDKLPYLSPGYGKGQLNRVLAELARATPGSNFTLASLKNLPVRLFPSRALLVFISPFSERDTEALARLRSFGYQIVLISPDPVDFASSSAGNSPAARLAFRAARLERIMQFKQLIRLGIKVVDWQVQEPLSTVLQTAFRQVGPIR